MAALTIDLHTHLYPSFDIGHSLHAAYQHLRTAEPKSEYFGLLLAQIPGRTFPPMPGCFSIEGITHSQISPEVDLLTGFNGPPLHVFHAVQHVSKDGLEVITIRGPKNNALGLTARDLITQTTNDGGIALLPRGVGKWFSKRRMVLNELIAACAPGDMVLSDIPVPGPDRKLLCNAAQRGFGITAGSDPLPLTSHGTRLGSYGSRLNIRTDISPGPALIEALRSARGELPRFGTDRSILTALGESLWLRIKK